MFKGSFTALVTPMKNGSLDEAAFRGLVDWQIAEGTHGLVPVGTTGESPTLSHDEHRRVVQICIDVAGGRVPVMAGAGSNNTREAIELATFAEKAGADALLVVTPYYNKPTQEGFYLHYKALAEAVSLPICVYNIPGRTAKNIEPETIARMGELANITMVKEATGSMDQASQIMALSNLTLLSGDDSLTLPLLAIGARGVISVVGNIVPRDVIALVSAFESGDLAGSLAWHRKLFPLCRDMLGLATNPIPIKAAMRLLGRDTGQLRMPMTPLDREGEARLRNTLSKYGLL